jgi:hypothetical protein
MENNIQKSDLTDANASGISIYNKITDPLEAIKVMGAMIAESGMFGCQKHEQGMVLAMQCLAEGKAPLEMAKTYHIVEGKLSMRADAMLGRFLTTGGKVKWLERTNTKVSAHFSHGDNENVLIESSIEDMKANGVAMDKTGKYLKTNWQKFPRQMLTARVISEGVRLLAPQLIAGVYTPEEVQDFTNDSKPMAPVARVATASMPVKVEALEVMPVAESVEVSSAGREKLNTRLHDLLLIHEPKATQELIRLGYIKEGQTYVELDPMAACRLLDNPAKFLARIQS